MRLILKKPVITIENTIHVSKKYNFTYSN